MLNLCLRTLILNYDQETLSPASTPMKGVEMNDSWQETEDSSPSSSSPLDPTDIQRQIALKQTTIERFMATFYFLENCLVNRIFIENGEYLSEYMGFIKHAAEHIFPFCEFSTVEKKELRKVLKLDDPNDLVRDSHAGEDSDKDSSDDDDDDEDIREDDEEIAFKMKIASGEDILEEEIVEKKEPPEVEFSFSGKHCRRVVSARVSRTVHCRCLVYLGSFNMVLHVRDYEAVSIPAFLSAVCE